MFLKKLTRSTPWVIYVAFYLNVRRGSDDAAPNILSKYALTSLQTVNSRLLRWKTYVRIFRDIRISLESLKPIKPSEVQLWRVNHKTIGRFSFISAFKIILKVAQHSNILTCIRKQGMIVGVICEFRPHAQSKFLQIR